MFLKSTLNLHKPLLESTFLRKTALRNSSFCIYSKDYQFLQESKVPTFHFQQSLPRLPIPSLEKTCERYLTAQKPLLSQEQYRETQTLVNNFKKKDGANLHEELLKHDILNSHTSYISKPWFDMYLSDRVPLPINYNPVLVFNKSLQDENNKSQLVKATNLVISSLRFLRSLRKSILSPEVYHLDPKKSDTDVFRLVTRMLPSSISWYGAYFFKAFPLDMSQYNSLFGTSRIPQLNQDILCKTQSSRHILVMRKGHFFIVDVLDKYGNILDPGDIYTCLKFIVDEDLSYNKKSIGILTTENRDNWAKTRAHLQNLSQENHDALQSIDTALFAVCLDEEYVDMDPEKIMRTFLHGDGFNRWFDKSFSLLLSKDSQAAINFEHSWGDGVAVLRYFQDVYNDTNKRLIVGSETQKTKIDVVNVVKELNFRIDEKVDADIEAAREKYEKLCKSIAFNKVECSKLGKNLCKSVKISPDSVMQLSFQVAYHRAFGNFVATYESCSTAAFKHGRTETVRPCTEATKEFALKMNGKNKPSTSEMIELMQKCSTIHGNLTKDAAMGQGFDRHLFALKNLSTRAGYNLPNLFEDEAYKKMNYNILSTSTLSSDAVLLGGFGPVVPDGLGLGYSILNDVCGSMVSSYPEKRSGAQFVEALRTTLDDLAEIIRSK